MNYVPLKWYHDDDTRYKNDNDDKMTIESISSVSGRDKKFTYT